jgi:hypothetical protein
MLGIVRRFMKPWIEAQKGNGTALFGELQLQEIFLVLR